MDYYQKQFKRSEMASELAHEDRENDKERTPSQKSRMFQNFLRLKALGSCRNDIEEMDFLAYKKRFNWF